MADRTQLQHIVASLTEGIMLIEPDQTISYANAAALKMHGVGKLEELGRTVTEYRETFILRYRNNHLVERGRYPIDRVVAGEAFDEVVVVVAHKNHPDHDWTHRIRSLVLVDERGHPDCLVLVIHDITALIEAEDRFERSFAANPAPALICRVSDLRLVRVNDGFIDMTGFRREDVLGQTVGDLGLLAGAGRRDLAMERLQAGQSIPQMEACLSLPGEAEKLVIVAGQPIEMGDEPYMLFTFADLEPRRKAETALRQSEERFSKSFKLSPVATTIGTVEGLKYVEVNEAFTAVLGFKTEEIVGRGADELRLWVDEVQRQRFHAEIAKTGGVQGFEARLRTKSGSELDCLLSAETATIGGQPCILCAFQDLTERKRTEEELIQAIEAVMADASWFSRGVVEKLAALRHPSRPGRSEAVAKGVAELTGREREILTLVCRGLSDPEIGHELKLSRNTVRNHVAALYRKLAVNRRAAVIVWARERGIGNGALPKRARNRRANRF